MKDKLCLLSLNEFGQLDVITPNAEKIPGVFDIKVDCPKNDIPTVTISMRFNLEHSFISQVDQNHK